MNKPSSKLRTKTQQPSLTKQRSPLADVANRSGTGTGTGTGCFRFLKPSCSSQSQSNSSRYNSNSSSNSKSTSNSSTNSSLFRPKSARSVPKSAPPKNPPNRLKEKKSSKPIKPIRPIKPVKPYQSILIITPQKEESKREGRSGSGSTPPIQCSISPEIPCGSLAPTPNCFAAGHVVTGVVDRRKCRPRGILNIGNGSEVSFESFDDTGKARVSTSSPFLPPLIAGASVWLSSPSKIINEDNSDPRTCSAKCQAEASVNWFLSPHEKSGIGSSSRFSPVKSESIFEKTPACQSNLKPVVHGKSSWFSPVQSESPFEKTPGFESNLRTIVHRTPTSDSSISPFSIILKRASESSAMKLSISNQQIVDVAASSAGIFESASLNTACKGSDSESSILPLPGGSFQFRNDFTPLNSVDLNGFANPNRATPESDSKISWRDGLASRIFEMGEKDCCIWLSDCEDDGGLEIEDPFEATSKISRDQNAKCRSSPSIEVRAESITVEGEDELVSPDESDWRLFYKNHLFEL